MRSLRQEHALHSNPHFAPHLMDSQSSRFTACESLPYVVQANRASRNAPRTTSPIWKRSPGTATTQMSCDGSEYCFEESVHTYSSRYGSTGFIGFCRSRDASVLGTHCPIRRANWGQIPVFVILRFCGELLRLLYMKRVRIQHLQNSSHNSCAKSRF